MTFISWSVFGILLMLAEISSGSLYLLAIGLAFIYPAIADYQGVPMDTQLAVLGSGILAHALIVLIFHKLRPARPKSKIPTDVGERVEVIEWLDECTARVSYRGQEFQADKVRSEMPDAEHGIIKSAHGSRFIISTE